MSEVEAIAKAVEKSAEFGSQSLQTGEKVGGFFARVFKEPIEAGVGMLTDRLRVMRLKRWDAMADEVNEILARRGVKETKAVPPKLGLPLLEEAAFEEEPTLQELWSRLLANAMDPNFGAEVRIAYTEIIKSMTAADAKVLKLMYNSLRVANNLDINKADQVQINGSAICAALNMPREEYLLSIENLMRLRCAAHYFAPVEFGKGLKSDGSTTHLSSYSGSEMVVITPLGIRFVEACSDGVDFGVEHVRASHSFTHSFTVGLTPEDIGIKTMDLR